MALEIVAGWYEVDVDLHTQQVTLLPASIEGLSIPPALLFTKDQKQGWKGSSDCNRKVKQEIKWRCKQ